ncbi:MAG: metallopeptidase TldD-related protein [Chloroflexota bacterium]
MDIEELLGKARKVADQAEVFALSQYRSPVSFEANRLKNVQARESQSISLRLIRQGRVGLATTAGAVDADALIDMALQTCQVGVPTGMSLPSSASCPEVDVFDPAVETMTIETMIQTGSTLIDQVAQHYPEVLCDARVDKVISEVRIINSQGGQCRYRKSTFAVNLDGVLVRGSDILFVGDGQNSCRCALDLPALVAEVIRQLDWSAKSAQVATRNMPVVFTPHGVAGVLAPPLSLAFNGRQVFEKASWLTGKLAKQVFDPALTLVDNPTTPYQPMSRPCDDEGVPSQATPLVQQGVVSSFVYDLHTAALAGVSSTGHGSRGYGGLPRPAVSSLVVNEGQAAFTDMLRGIDEGLVVEQAIGADQGNLLAGDFSGNVLLGYKIDHGEIAGRVKDTMVSGNAFQLLSNIRAVGREGRWVGGFLFTPAICCDNVSVAGKA